MSDSLTILATTYAPVCRYRVDKHLVGYYTIQYMSEGAIELSYDDRLYRLEGPWFWAAYPGPRTRFHRAAGIDHWFHRHVGFTGPRVGRWLALGLLPAEPWPAPPGRDWAADVDNLIAATKLPDPRGQLRSVNLLERLLLDLADARADAGGNEEPWLAAARDSLTEEGVFTPDYERIAESAGMSITTLRRRFRATMGMSPHEYVLLSRLAAARELLVETDLPLKGIAERLGYDNVYFFCRQFKQEVGVPPGLYRKTRSA
jgi:AraC-like DNA-binding protein